MREAGPVLFVQFAPVKITETGNFWKLRRWHSQKRAAKFFQQ